MTAARFDEAASAAPLIPAPPHPATLLDALVAATESVDVAEATVVVVSSSQSPSSSESSELLELSEDDAEVADWPVTVAMLSRPGSWVMSVSWVPSAMGPLGFAAHEPSGLRASVCPKGMVPAAPSARPPTNVFWFAPWNWHWKRPLSSEFFGACWQ